MDDRLLLLCHWRRTTETTNIDLLVILFANNFRNSKIRKNYSSLQILSNLQRVCML
jgi:hypothetical protein